MILSRNHFCHIGIRAVCLTSPIEICVEEGESGRKGCTRAFGIHGLILYRIDDHNPDGAQNVRRVFRGGTCVAHGCESVLRASARAMHVFMSREVHLMIRFVMQIRAEVFLRRVSRMCPGSPIAVIGMLSAASGNRGGRPGRPHSQGGGSATA